MKQITLEAQKARLAKLRGQLQQLYAVADPRGAFEINEAIDALRRAERAAAFYRINDKATQREISKLARKMARSGRKLVAL